LPTTSGQNTPVPQVQRRLLLPKPYSDELARDLKVSGFNIDVDVLARVASSLVQDVASVIAEPLSASTDGAVIGAPQVSPAEAARRLLAVFAHVRSLDVIGTGDASQKEPLGMVLDVQVSMANARGVPVDVYWEIIGAGSDSRQLNADWVKSTPAYRLNATDDTDGGSFRLWVPLPNEKGDYAISLTAKSTDDELPNASIVSETFH
jgi:hypothetical protein